jgi:hypothetical protein
MSEDRLIRRTVELGTSSGKYTAGGASRFVAYSSPNIVMTKARMVRVAGNVTVFGEMRNTYKVLACKLEGKMIL